jgi:hypothetical protein
MYIIIEYNDVYKNPYLLIHRYTVSYSTAKEEVDRLIEVHGTNVLSYQKIVPYQIIEEGDFDLIDCRPVADESMIVERKTFYMITVSPTSSVSIHDWFSPFYPRQFPVEWDPNEKITAKHIYECYKKGILTFDELFNGNKMGTSSISIRPSHRIFVIAKCNLLS